jgi:hypothetical protein
MSTKAQRFKAWSSWGTSDELPKLPDKVIKLSIEYRLYDNPIALQTLNTIDEARKRDSLAPFLVGLKLRGLI